MPSWAKPSLDFLIQYDCQLLGNLLCFFDLGSYRLELFVQVVEGGTVPSPPMGS